MSAPEPASGADPDRGARVEIEVVEVTGGGHCSAGLVPGKRWTVDSPMVPQGMCMWAWAAIAPFLTPLRFGASFPWEDAPGTARVACPDPDDTVVFRLTVL